MLALLFFALALPAVLLAFLFGLGLGARRGYARGKRDGRATLSAILAFLETAQAERDAGADPEEAARKAEAQLLDV